jgi:two-component system response regulator MprA
MGENKRSWRSLGQLETRISSRDSRLGRHRGGEKRGTHSLVLLLLDADEVQTNWLQRSLRSVELTWSIEVETRPQPGIEAILEDRFDVALLELSFGKAPDGFDVCRRVRTSGAQLGLVMLTAIETRDARLRAFQAGADHYVTKGGTLEEIRTSVITAAERAARRRRESQVTRSDMLTIGRMRIDLSCGAVFVDNRLIELTRHQRRMVVRLAKTPGQFVGHAELCEAAGIQLDPSFKNLRNEILRLNRRLGSAARQLQVMRGVGYRLGA